MTKAQHPDEIERLRAALWGDEEVERHAFTCEECAADLACQRRIRDAFRRWAEAEPSERTTALFDPVAPPAESGPVGARWYVAQLVPQLGGVRSGPTSDLHVVCAAGELHVDMLLHRLPAAGRCSISGQVLRADAAPAAGIRVTLFVDGRQDASTQSDSFGEFAFSGIRGGRFGLGIGEGPKSARIAIPAQGPSA